MFQKFPEFITDDTRYHNPDDPTSNSKEAPRGQIITFEKSEKKHKLLLPNRVCENSSVLDLGSCISASGAWALEHGAMFYTGVEISDYSYEMATKNLKKYFSPALWTLHKQSVLGWFEEHNDPYDVVLAGGILYAHEDQIDFLTKCANLTKKYLIIESKTTSPVDSDIPTSVYKKIWTMKTGDHTKKDWAMIRCSNIPFMNMVLNPLGFELEKEITWPHSRFAAIYVSSLTP
jgi:16S rRNA G966 N2-methylase RsmD